MPTLLAAVLGAALAAPTGPRLVVLGVAQDGGHPQAGCARACCEPTWTDPTLRHRVVSLGLVDPRTQRRWMFDLSPDFPEQLRALDAVQPASGPLLDGVFLTHAHIGHYTGLMHLGREVLGTRGIPLWVMPRMREFLTNNGPWSQLVSLGNVALQDIPAEDPVLLGADLSVTALTVPHRAEYTETVGYVIRGPLRSALYLPDIDKWERWSTPLEQILAEVDVAYLDATFYDGSELPGRRMDEVPHPFVVETLARLAAAPAALREKVRLIHLNHTNPLLYPDSAASERVRAAGLRVAVEGEQVAL